MRGRFAACCFGLPHIWSFRKKEWPWARSLVITCGVMPKEWGIPEINFKHSWNKHPTKVQCLFQECLVGCLFQECLKGITGHKALLENYFWFVPVICLVGILGRTIKEQNGQQRPALCWEEIPLGDVPSRYTRNFLGVLYVDLQLQLAATCYHLECSIKLWKIHWAFWFLKKQELLSALEINNIGADALMIHTTYPLLILTSISV
jgi:hypothetical protein